MSTGKGGRGGQLIVFEGAEGVGKTTQIKLLAERLTVAGIPNIAVREPGGTPVGDAIRKLLLDPEQAISSATEALLFMASRAELITRELNAALAAGEVVILDRFFLSTYAYQIVGRGLNEADVRAANRLATGGLVPDLTLLLDLPLEEGMRRAAIRAGDAGGGGGGLDRMERSGNEFHERVAEAFARFTDPIWQREHPECGKIVRVDATGTEQEVYNRIWTIVAELSL